MANKKAAPRTQVNGHRQRLKARFLDSGLDGFLDYEVIELLLTLGTPRRDCKPIAKAAIDKFKGLNGVLTANVEELSTIKGIGTANSIGIQLFNALLKRYHKEQIKSETIFNSPQSIFDYLRVKIGGEKKEHFVLLFLDTKNKLILSEVSTGTLNASLVHPREVFSKAIYNHASHVIIAHNHPSGDPTPSDEDITTTNRLVEAGKILGISIVDHMIICSDNFVSLKNLKLIP